MVNRSSIIILVLLGLFNLSKAYARVTVYSKCLLNNGDAVYHNGFDANNDVEAARKRAHDIIRPEGTYVISCDDTVTNWFH